MRLENYIVEEEKGLAYYIPKIQAECKPFLRDIKNAVGTLFRDDTKNRNKPVWKKTTRTDREPLDTPVDIHNAIDNIFLKKFGWKARSQGLFCWPLQFTTTWIYGKWLVFPAGNYKYIWSEQVDDLWAALGDVPGGGYDTEIAINYFEDKLLPTYTDKNLKQSLKWQGEVMLNCKYSYLVKPELMEPVNEMLGLNWQNAKFTGRKI